MTKYTQAQEIIKELKGYIEDQKYNRSSGSKAFNQGRNGLLRSLRMKIAFLEKKHLQPLKAQDEAQDEAEAKSLEEIEELIWNNLNELEVHEWVDGGKFQEIRDLEYCKNNIVEIFSQYAASKDKEILEFKTIYNTVCESANNTCREKDKLISDQQAIISELSNKLQLNNITL